MENSRGQQPQQEHYMNKMQMPAYQANDMYAMQSMTDMNAMYPMPGMNAMVVMCGMCGM